MQCTGCLSVDCGLCVCCKDMKKFGGTGKKKNGCLKRKCVGITNTSVRRIIIILLLWYSLHSLNKNRDL